MRHGLPAEPVAFAVAGVALLTGTILFCASHSGVSSRIAGLDREADSSVPSLVALLGLPTPALRWVDIGRMNVLCAEGLAGAGGSDLNICLAKLDEMAARVRSETARHLYRFQAKPAEFEDSEGFFRMLMLAVVLYEDFSVRYNPDRISTPGTLDPNDHFFADSRDLFLHGLLVEQSSSPSPSPTLNPLPRHSQATAGQPLAAPRLGEGGSTLNHPHGTWSSLPVLQVAVGRRLGYPLKLVTTKGHLFVRWEGAQERFNIEAAGNGVSRFADDYYRHWPLEVAPAEEAAEGYLKSLTPPEELAVFLSIRGMCLREAGRLPEAAEAFAAAARLAPACRGYKVMLASLQSRPGPGAPPVKPPAEETAANQKSPNL